MSGHKYLADTNTYIFLLDKHPTLRPLLNSEWYFSFITEIELKGKHQITPTELRNITDLLSTSTKVAYSEEINELTISIRQRFRIKVPDAVIAATSICKNLPLLTFDKGFTVIKSLDLVLLDP